MNLYQNLVINLRQKLKHWLEENQSKIPSLAGIGVTAWAIGALFGQLTIEAQTTSWAVIIATLSAELGKEFVVGLVEQIREKKLSADEVSRIVQTELDRRQNLPDLQKFLEAVELLPTTLEVILRQKNMQLLTELQSDLSTYPQVISSEIAAQLQSMVIPELARLNGRLDDLDLASKRTLQILTSFVATPSLTLTTGSEEPFLVYISSLVEEFSLERQILRHTLTALGLTKPWAFELTPNSDQMLNEVYLEKVRQCDFLILLIDENVSSNMESEFDEAIASNKSILAFLKKDKADKDQSRSIAAQLLIQRIPTKPVAFSNLTDLALQARMAICDEIIRRVRDQAIQLSDESFQNVQKTGNRLWKAVANLPARRYTRLVGRSDDLTILREKLFSHNRTDYSIIAITGLGGIGKTALAYELAEEAIIEGRFEGLVWESAKSEEFEADKIIPIDSQLLTGESLLHSIAIQIGDENLAYTPPKELEKSIRSLLNGRPHLIVVDNLETVSTYRQLAEYLDNLIRPSHTKNNTRVILTCRERLFGIPYVYDHYVRGLSRSDSYAFITEEAHSRGATNLSVIPEELKERIFLITHGMPLAMKLIVSQFLAGIPLDTELDRLQNAKESDLYEYIYLALWLKLSVPAKKVLVSAAAFSSSVSRSMLQPVSRIPDVNLEDVVAELVHLSLIEASDDLVAANRRYSIHPLTRWFINSPLRNRWQRSRKL